MLLHYALIASVVCVAGTEGFLFVDTAWPASLITDLTDEIGGPDGSCTRILPADNGKL